MSGSNQEMLQIGGDEDRTIGGSTPDSNMSFEELTTSFEVETVEIMKSEMVTSFSETKKLTKFTRDLTIDVTSTVVMNTEILEAVNARLSDDADVPPLIHIREHEEIIEAVNEVVTSRFQLDEPIRDDVDLNSSGTSTLDTSQDFPSLNSEEKLQENDELVDQVDAADSVLVSERIAVEELLTDFSSCPGEDFVLESKSGFVESNDAKAKMEEIKSSDSVETAQELLLKSFPLETAETNSNHLFLAPSIEAETEKKEANKNTIEEIAEIHSLEIPSCQVESEQKSLKSMSSEDSVLKSMSDPKEKKKLVEQKSKDATSVRTFESVSKSLSSFASSSDELKFIVNSSSDEIMEIPPPDYETEDSLLSKPAIKSGKEKTSNGVLSASMNDIEGKKKKRRTSFRDIFMKPLRYKKSSKTSIPELDQNFAVAPAATSTLTKVKKEQEAKGEKIQVSSEKIKVPSSKVNSLKRITSSSRENDKETQLCASWFDRGRQRKARRANATSSSEEEQVEKESTMIICTCREGKTKGKCPSCSSNYIEIPVNFREISPDDVEKQQTLSRDTLNPNKEFSGRPRSAENKQRQRSFDVELPPVTYTVPSLGDIVVSFCKKNPQVFTLNNLSSVKRREDLGPYGVEDMINIDDLNEASLLWNLRIRYDKELIYTYIGSILIAVNPYRMSDVYGLEMVKKYEGQVLGTMPPILLSSAAEEGEEFFEFLMEQQWSVVGSYNFRKLRKCQQAFKHLFAIGSAAYTRLTGPEPENQVVIISGESGAGKTESTKLVMQYLAAVNKSHSNLITEQILEAAPLLESFGNAKTVRNDNSSRFGKYLQVYFKGGIITGAKITEYLLEKSRIVTHAAEERNYHVFYELLKGLKPEEKEKYGLYSADKYFYLNQGGNSSIPTKDDYEDFQSLLSAFQVLGFTLEEQDTIFRILAAVLHFGNVYFHRKPLKHGQEGVEVGSDVEVKWAAHLLQLSVDGIMRALTTKTTEARNERMFTPLNIDQALDARDAIAKALYSSLFSWLVNRVNTIVSKGPKPLSISILDIFGFEDFKENSFEQLCINYANESLQAHFNRHIFRLEQQEYIKEKIEWQTINFTDNQPVINLICKKPVGILHLLDDESNFPKATDQSFLEKAHYNHALNEYYCRPRLNSDEFGIKHYAGLVWYSVDGFLDKNRDTLRMDVLDLLISSKISMISRMFQELKRNNEASKSANRSDGRFITMKPRTPTVAARFNDSLTTLLESMSKCNPWFVRCLKPNNDKIPMKFDMPVVLEQLRYTGMLETIRIRKTGYPVRMRYAQFAERFRCLVPVRIPKGAPPKEICRVVLDRDPRNRDHYQLGSSKVFMREPLQQRLEKERMVIQEAAAVRIQTAVRGYLARRRYKLMKKSAVTIQARVRGYIARKRYRRLRRGIVKAQAKLRGTRQRKLYLEMKEELKKRAEADRERVKVHKQKMEEESRAIASTNQLEIPADLAFIVSKLDDWHPIHTERNIVKLVGQPPQREDYFELPPDIHEYSFQKFAKSYFKSHKLGAMQEPIQSPFLPKTKEVDYQDSIAIFKLILRFCSDPSLSPKREFAIGSYIVNKGLLNDNIRDEILCQLVNQSWQNPDESNAMRVWLLLSSCLSAFAPSPSLYKYLLKYVSDQGPNGYDVVCQQKLLQAARNAAPSGLTRSYPPSILEWRCNKKKMNMALEAKFPDENSSLAGLESWATCEEVASLLVNSRGINEDAGWTLNLSNGPEQYDLHGTEFMLDVLSELETPPAFPVMKSQFLKSVRNDRGSKKSSISEERNDRKISVSSEQAKRDHKFDGESEGFQQRSLSLGNLMENKEPVPAFKVNQFGLSQSKLNERYLSTEKLNPTRPSEPSWNSRNRKYSNDVGSSSESEGGPDEWESRRPSVESSNSKTRVGRTTTLEGAHRNSREMEGGDSDFDIESSPVAAIKEYRTRHGHPRFVKSQQAFRKSKGERDFLRSSAHSDTSETPSLASHVRRVRVPSHASDVDQFLDDLFLPVLDVNIDDLSDARSLATSIKGGNISKRDEKLSSPLVDDLLSLVPLAPELHCLAQPSSLAKNVKGGGRGDARRKREPESPIVQQAPHGYASPAPLLLSNIPMPMYTPTAATPDFEKEQNALGSPRFHTPGQGEGVFRFPMAPTPYGYMTPDFLNQTPQPIPMPYMRPFLTPDSRVNTPATPLSPVTPFPVMPGYAFSPTMLSGMMSPGATGFDINNLSAIQQNMQRLFLQSAVAQNMQIQQQLIAQNQALQQLLQQSATATYGGTPEPAFPLQDQWPAERRSGGVREIVERHTDQRTREHIPPPVLPKSKSGTVLNTSSDSTTSSTRLIPRLLDDRKQLHDSSRLIEHASPPLLRKGDGSSDPKPYSSPAKVDVESRDFGRSMPKAEGNLESRPLAVSSRRTSQTEMEQAQPAKNGVPPPPPLPMEPLFSGDQPFMDQYGRAKTVRIGKWRWPPAKGEGDEEPAANFLEFKMQKQAQKKLMAQRSREDNIPEVVEFDSFDMGSPEEDVKVRKSVREVKETLRAEPLEDEKVETPKPKPPGSIGKLKLSGELRSKLEMVHSKKSSKSSMMSEEGSQKDEGGTVTKLAEHRKLLLEKQLYGGRWQSVEEIESITRIASENADETDRSRPRRSSVTITQEHRTRSTSSPPSSYYSPSSTPNLEARKFSDANMIRKFSSQSQLVERTEIIEREYVAEFEQPGGESRVEGDDIVVDATATKLHNPLQASFFTYNMVPWTTHVRKEVFSPSESLVSPLAVHLVFAQIVQDTDNTACLRMLRNDRAKMKQTLDSFGISASNVHQSNHKMSVKRNIIELAKEFPLYFSRMYPVSGGRQSSDVQFLAVNHSGLRLVKRETTPEDRLIVLDTISQTQLVKRLNAADQRGASVVKKNNSRHCVIEIIGVIYMGQRKELRFDDVIETSVPRASCLQIRLKSGGKLSLYSHRATLIRDMIERFAAEADTSSQTFVKALADYVTKEPGVLGFRKGDLIRVANPADNYLGKGWLYGMLNGKAGVFPTEYVEFLDFDAVNNYELEREMSHWRDGESPLAESPQDSSSSPMSADDGKHSLLQFALQHFRQNPNERTGSGEDADKKKKSKKPKEPGADWTWKQQVDMVKFSKVPISSSLLRLDSNELSKLAVECFLAIMRYMGDLPMGKNQSEVDCVYTLLMNCHKHAPLRDEVYCQLMKQTTSNRSARPDSCQRGWRLLCIVAAYFDCSQTLQPYLLKYLESAAYDKRRAYHGTALVCLQNLRKTIRYGGRKNVPSIEEITALTAGRNAKRQIYQLPGGTERIINTKSTTVVQDIIEEICLELNVRSAEEMEEFSLYCIVEGDTFTMPLAREEYILDVTTELHKNEQVFYLIFCRSVWHHPLRLDSPLYVEVAFNQIAPDYLEGLLLVMPGEALSQETVYDIAKIAALLHRAPGLEHVPNMKETKFLLPKPALAVRDIKPPQWVSLVQSSWKEVDLLETSTSQGTSTRWPLFGSSFFAVKRVAEPGERAEHILALNRRGVHFLDVITHETLIHYPFSEVISTRKVKSEDGALFLDMKCGNLMQQRITRIQTDQAHEISRLIRQYISIEQRQQNEKPKK